MRFMQWRVVALALIGVIVVNNIYLISLYTCTREKSLHVINSAVAERTTENQTRERFAQNIKMNTTRYLKIVGGRRHRRHRNHGDMPALPKLGLCSTYAVGCGFIITNSDICDSPVDLLIMVHSSVNNFARRRLIRSQWANKTLFEPYRVRVIFLLGKTRDSRNNSLLIEENELFRDIVQGDFMDTYRNLTLKGVLGLNWITKFCADVRVVAKADDDIVLNTYVIIERLLPAFEQPNTIWCSHIKNNTMGIIRDVRSKWYVEPGVFPSLTSYPVPYCSGFTVFISGDLIPKLYEAAFTTQFFFVDDVFVFGLLAYKVKEMTYHDVHDVMTIYQDDVTQCIRKHSCSYISMLKIHILDIEPWGTMQAARNKYVFLN